MNESQEDQKPEASTLEKRIELPTPLEISEEEVAVSTQSAAPAKDEAAERNKRLTKARYYIKQTELNRVRVPRDNILHEMQLEERRNDQTGSANEFGSTVFGASQLQHIEKLRTSDFLADSTIAERVQNELSIARKSLHIYVYDYSNSQRISDIVGDLENVIDISTIPMRTRSAAELFELTDRLSDEQTEAFLRNHTERVQADIERRNADAEIDTLKEKFITKLSRRYENGTFPLDQATIEKRLELVKISFADPIFMTINLASQDYRTGSIQLSLYLQDGQVEAVLDHELLHAICGVGVHAELSPQAEEDPKLFKAFDITDARLQYRQGLQITRDHVTGRLERFSWLDEAAIHEESMELNDQAESNTYSQEREIYRKLLSRVPKAAFLKAQYQDYDVEQGWPAWGELQTQLADAFEPRILLTLDKFIPEDAVSDESYQNALHYLNALIATKQE